MHRVDARIDAYVEQWQSQRAPITSLASAPWIEKIERRAGLKFPKVFLSLVLRYGFPSLAFQRAELFGNIGDESRDDLAGRLFLDPHLSPWLLERGLLHFARRELARYDPICFDVRAGSPFDAPIVQVDHEDVLCSRDSVHIESVASGLFDFLDALGEFNGDERWITDPQTSRE